MNSFAAAILFCALGADAPDYTTVVAPIFEKRCAGCHNATEREGKFSVESIGTMLEGGEHGVAITPGQSASSRLWLLIAGTMEPRMPPEDEEPLTDSEKEIIQRWIDAGANGPQGTAPMRREIQVPKVPVSKGVVQPLTAMTVSADGNWIVEARSSQLVLRNSSADTKHEANESGKILSVNFSQDGKYFVTAGGLPGVFGEATIYRSNDGAKLQNFGEHRDVLYDAVFSPDGKHLATAGYDRTIRLWDAETGKLLKSFQGHNGAVLDLDFSPDGKVIASASADNTVKLWSVSSGERLDTLGQPQREALTVAFSPNGKFIAVGSADNRLRIYKFTSRDRAEINPLLETRFADETPLVKLAFHPSGDRLAIISQAGNVKIFETDHWTQLDVIGKVGDLATSLVASNSIRVAQIDGKIWEHAWPTLPSKPSAPQLTSIVKRNESPDQHASDAPKKPQEATETDANDKYTDAQRVSTPVRIKGVIEKPGDEDWYRFSAKGGESWMLEVKAARDKSKLDSFIEVRNVKGEPVERVRMQAVRDTYFTFRGKDSDTSDDFRVFAWEEMELNEYFYAAGEITRLWLYPRGPDSGFKVYPGEGKRWTFFDTSPLAHALAEPAYIVKPLAPGEQPIANGLPVFPIFYQNDDESRRRWGADSQLHFMAPETGEYLVRLRDTRGEGGESYNYELTIRPSQPSYNVTLTAIDKPIPRGAGREFTVRAQREDGFEGAVEVHISDLPRGVHATSPVVIEPGQLTAVGIIYADADAPISEQPFTPKSRAVADIDGVLVEQEVKGWKEIKLAEKPKVQVLIEPIDGDEELSSVDSKMVAGADSKAIELPENGPVATLPWTLRLKPGTTVAARLIVLRNKFEARVEFGKEGAGRNLPFGVFVDNVGLSGLMVPEGASRRTFFITSSPVATPQRRFFYLKAEVDGGLTSSPVVLALDP